MSGRSPSGVASLRARFEQNANSESPSPSRGRSPAGSFTSDTSRPLSKVRTSFISVGEPSGQMSNLTEETDGGAAIAGDGAQFSKGEEQSKLNGAGPTSAPKETGVELAERKKDQTDVETGKKSSEKQDGTTTGSDSATADLGKSTTGGSSNAPSAQPTNSKGEDGSINPVSTAKDAPNLGSILKGSAFEKEESKKASASQKPAQAGGAKATGKATTAPKTSATPAITKPVEKSAAKPAEKPVEKAIEKDKVTNGKPKESKAVETKTQPKAQIEQPAPSKTQTAPKPEPVAAAKTAVKEAEKMTDTSEPPPAPVPSAAAPPSVPPSAAAVSATAPPTTDPPAASNTKEKAAKPTVTPSSQASSKVPSTAKKEVSPEKHKPESSKEVPKEATKAPTSTTAKPSTTRTDHKNDGPSASSKSVAAKSAASAASTASKPPAKNTTSQKPPPTSGVGFTKPKPRSPTRPVKLPAHLVAQTAASAAKHGDESHTEPHKDTPTAGNKPSSSKPPVHAPQQRKQPRMSMPATSSSKALDKEKAKPRMSVAGGSTASGSFLERMMRPTQSSAQKTHERLDPTKHSPPRKSSGSRNVSGAGPKTVTGASTHKPDEHAHNDGGHGHGREKHGGPTKSETEHGEGQEVPSEKTVGAPESTLQEEGQKSSAAGIAGDTPKDA